MASYDLKGETVNKIIYNDLWRPNSGDGWEGFATTVREHAEHKKQPLWSDRTETNSSGKLRDTK